MLNRTPSSCCLVRWFVVLISVIAGTAGAAQTCSSCASGDAGTSWLQMRARRSSVALGTAGQAGSSANASLYVATRRARHAAFVGSLDVALTEVSKSQNTTNAELDKLITRFINHHAADQDKCPAKLLEAKHQLNQLHKAILDLANEINTTERELQNINDESEDTKDKENKEIKKGKEGDDRKKKDIEEHRKTLAVLRLEMEEMRQIAQPNVTMNQPQKIVRQGGGKLTADSLLQLVAAKHRDIPFSGVALANDNAHEGQVQNLVMETKDVASSMVSCYLELQREREQTQRQLLLVQGNSSLLEAVEVSAPRQPTLELLSELQKPDGRNCSVNTTVSVTVGNTTKTVMFNRGVINGTAGFYHCSRVDPGFGGVLMLHCKNGKLTSDPRGCLRKMDEATCKKQKAHLEDTYVKAYVELARLIKEYEDLTSSDEDDDSDKKIIEAKKVPLDDKRKKLEKDKADKLRELDKLRPRLEDMIAAEDKLREHIRKLSKECELLPATERGLQKVRLAIRALEACPGLAGRAEFHIPLWAGEWVTFSQDKNKNDGDNDATALQACKAKFGDVKGMRVAEVSEILAHSVEGMPVNNTADVPVLGACPQCEGDTDSSNKAGHSRICWDKDVPLDRPSRRLNCNTGPKAIMCVYDRGDIRKLQWSFTTTTTTRIG